MSTSIAILSGSPSAASRSDALLRRASHRLRAAGTDIRIIEARRVPADELLGRSLRGTYLDGALHDIERAAAVVVATPVYKASFSGLLKAFLDLRPHEALKGKSVLPFATGGSAAHLLVLDYALRPVLAALGAYPVLPSVYATDAQIKLSPDAEATIESALGARLDEGVDQLLASLDVLQPAPLRTRAPLRASASFSLLPTD